MPPPDLAPEESKPVFDCSLLPPFIRLHLMEQDNACTQHPLFVVYQKRAIFGVVDYLAAYRWRNVGFDDTRDEPYHEDDANEIKRLDDYFKENHRPKPGWEKDYYVEVPEFVTACFTAKAAQHYLNSHSHSLNKPYIFVESLDRNNEMIAIRQFLTGCRV